MSVTQAREVAVRTHANQQDRDGSFHIAHVARVAEGVPLDAADRRVAWLHDVLEDSDVTADDLRESRAAAELAALILWTHDDSPEPYADYVARITGAPGRTGDLARAIKENDMLDNLRRCAQDHDPAVAQFGRALAQLWIPHEHL